MLDDLKYIHLKDGQDALGVAQKEWQQLIYDYQLTKPKFDKNQIQNIVFAGMGGSALGALLCTTWPGINVPFEICRNYYIPEYVNENTLLIASSYSGNTEETLEALRQAEQKKAKVIVIASGGRLVEIAEQKGYPLAKLPKVSQPRYATFFSFKAIVDWLVVLGLATPKVLDELKNTAEFVKQQSASWAPDVAVKQNQAKQIALELIGRSVVVYGGPKMFPAAYKWKININENAKNVAWASQYPEFSHNEFIGWTSHPQDKPYAIVDLRSNLEHLQVQKRFEITERMLSGRRPSPIVVDVAGKNVLQQLLWAVMLGDFVSLYMALLNGLNPTPVDIIEKMKAELSR